MWIRFCLLLAFTSAVFFNVSGSTCWPRDYGEGSVVCVCNLTYCDVLPAPPSSLTDEQVYVTESAKDGRRFQSSLIDLHSIDNSVQLDEDVVQLAVDRSREFQEILGFGGAFTDAAGINMAALPESMRNLVVDAYYSRDGSEYNMGRVPIASTDFSTRTYSYDDVDGDLTLDNFQLAQEDHDYKIPFLQRAASVSTQRLLLFGSPWSSPGWMKTNGKMEHNGILRGEPGGEYYQAYANYFVKFLQAYEQHNLTFWGLTTQNEPMDGYVYKFPFQCLGFTPESQRTFVAVNLGPALEAAGYGVDKVKLMIMDDQRILLPIWAKKVFSNATASKYASGVAFHWYMNNLSPASSLDKFQTEFPDKFLLSSEACEGFLPWEKKVILGDWSRAESYASDIIQDLLHWTSGWVDWNLALDIQGGPNWVQNFVDSPVIVNATAGEFYKQPMYYALAHFSKFIKSGSRRIGSTVEQNKKLEVAAFKRSDSAVVLVALNRNSKAIDVNITEVERGFNFRHTMAPNSIQTYLWKG